MKTWKIYAGAAALAIALLCLAGISNPGQLTQYFYGGITNAPLSTASNDVPFATQAELWSTNNTTVASKVTTNAIINRIAVGNGSDLTNMTADARKVTTNSVLDKLQLLDGSSLTNLNDSSREATNAALNKLALNDGSSLTNVNPAYYTGSFPVLTSALLSATLNFTNGALKFISAP
jgi:hypothetical protein